MNSLPLFVASTQPELVKTDKPKPSSKESFVTELLVSKYCSDYLALLLPMLGYQTLIAKDSWVSWISPVKIDKSLLQEFNVDAQRVRFIYPKQNQNLYDLTVKALLAGTSHCVVVVADYFNDEQLEIINNAAKHGETMALLVSHRHD